jgi:hypothetical protein
VKEFREMFFPDSYNTTGGEVLETSHIVTAIKQAIIRYETTPLNIKSRDGVEPLFITHGSEVPLFTHPISILNFQHKNYLCSDLRLFIRPSEDGKFNYDLNGHNDIKNTAEFNFAVNRTVMNLLWLTGSSNVLKNTLAFAGIVYTTWLAEAISKNYNLDFGDQTTLAIITSCFYQSLFSEDSELTEESKQKMATHTMKASRAPSELVFKVMDQLKPMTNVEDYCEQVKTILSNTRLNNFNLGTLLTIVRNSWYGANAKEIISVSIEHPPTFCAMVYASVIERTYKTSLIARISERFGKRGESDNFIKAFNDIMRENTKQEDKNHLNNIREFI